MAEVSGATTVRPRRRGLGRFSRFPVRRAAQWIIGIGVLVFAGVGIYKTLALGLFGGAAWRDLVVYGVGQGAIYAMIALGYTMVYGIIGMINFAHGDVFMIGAFLSLIALTGLSMLGISSVPLALALTLLMAAGIAALYGWTVERVAYRPLRGSFRLAPLISAIGMSIVLQNFAQVSQGARVKPIAPVIPGGVQIMNLDGFAVQLSWMQIAIVTTTLVVLALFTWLTTARIAAPAVRTTASSSSVPVVNSPRGPCLRRLSRSWSSSSGYLHIRWTGLIR